MYTSARLKKIRDEIRALKVVQPLDGGALTKPSTSATWTGTIDSTTPISSYSMLAAFEVTYTRNDGENIPPFTQFAYKLEPDEAGYVRSYSAVTGSSGSSVTYKIILADNWWPFGAATSGTLELTVNAYSLVEGTLSIQRVYS